MHDNWQRMTNMQKVISPARFPFLALALMFCASITMPSQVFAKTEKTGDVAPGRKMARQATKEKKLWITSDHSKHEILKQEFTSGPEVTKACISCHNQAALQFHQTIHWTWMDPITEKSAKLGKGGLSINNF